MALIKSTILSSISGSINGTVFSRNKGGAYARNKTVPTNPETDKQSQIRTALTSLSKSWGEILTESQRNAWRQWAEVNPVINRLGDQTRLSGIAAYQQINLYRIYTLNLVPVAWPPDPVGGEDPVPVFVGALDQGSYDAPDIHPKLQIDTTATTPGGDFGLTVYYSRPLSPGIRYYRGPYTAKLTLAITSSATITTLDEITFQPTETVSVATRIDLYRLSSGQKIWTVHTDPITFVNEP